jgi:hypothetical protein
VNADTKKVAHFQQVKRENDNEAGVDLTVVNPKPGQKYHFLVLTGHQERDYDQETDSKVAYSYKNEKPTLLAAGWLMNREIKGGEIISINMKPLVVDTVFTRGGVSVDAALAGVALPAGVAAGVAWTLTGGGFDTLLEAQNEGGFLGGGLGLSWGDLSFKDKRTILDWTEGDSPAIVVKNNRITLELGVRDENVSGSANFNLEYLPFGVNEMTIITADPEATGWIVRNGVNDTAQNEKTVFPTSSTGVSPWNDQDVSDDDAANGNGAVAFTFVDLTIYSIDLTFWIPQPVKGALPKTAFDAGTFNGTVSWAPPDSIFQTDMVYTATVTLYPGADATFPVSGPVSVTHTNSIDTSEGAYEFEHDEEEAPGTVSGDIAFDATGALPVDDLNLTDYLRIPENGKNPQTTLFLYQTTLQPTPPQYTGEVVWKDSKDDVVDESAKFKGGETYTATVELEAKQGYTFAADSIFVYGDEVIPAGNTAGKNVTVTIIALKAPVMPNTW